MHRLMVHSLAVCTMPFGLRRPDFSIELMIRDDKIELNCDMLIAVGALITVCHGHEEAAQTG